MKRTSAAKRIALLSLMTALSLISFLLEALLPVLPVPGAKIGLSNIFSLLPLFLSGLGDALLIVICRTVLGALFAGNASMLLYSLTAGVAAVIAARLMLLFTPKISLVCVSVVSAVCHNFTQLFVYSLLTRTPLILYYAPVLLAAGMIAGGVVGATAVSLLRACPLFSRSGAGGSGASIQAEAL